jgi:type IV secretory pathway TrbD component
MIRFLLVCLLIVSPCFADNGHLISTFKTDTYNVAIFAEPWPLRVGDIQFRAMVTDHDGNLHIDPDIVPFDGQILTINIAEPSTYTLEYFLAGLPQQPIRLAIATKASILSLYWKVWASLIFGLIFIILREILAKKQARRYPNR